MSQWQYAVLEVDIAKCNAPDVLLKLRMNLNLFRVKKVVGE